MSLSTLPWYHMPRLNHTMSTTVHYNSHIYMQPLA